MRRKHQIAWIPSLSVLALLSIGAGPPPEGTTVDIGLGAGTYEYRTGGCGTTEYANRANHVGVHGGIKHRLEQGAVAAADVNVALDRNVSSVSPEGTSDPNERGREDVFVSVAPRLGWHFKYGGAEIGGFGMGEVDTDQILWFASGSAWAGTTQVHGYAELLAGELTLTDGGLGRIGIGHHNEYFKVRGGFIPSVSEDDLQAEAAISVPIAAGFSAGGKVHGNTQSAFGAVQFSKTF